MVFDWNNVAVLSANYLIGHQPFRQENNRFYAKNGSIKNHTFRNFPRLKFEEGVLIIDCTFENCGSITFDESRIDNCTFSHIDTISLINSTASNCTFADFSCGNDAVIFLEDGKIHHCTFDKVCLTNEAYLCDGVGDCWIDHCTFTNIQTDRQDREIISCEEITGKIFKKKKKYCIVNEDSCTGIPLVP